METPNRYANGKIYRLVNSVDDEIYVGSTCTTLAKRLGQHKDKMKETPHRRIYTHIANIGGWQHFKMVLIELYPCKSKMELESRERHWIEQLKPSLNKAIPTRPRKEWVEENKDKMVEYKKVYAQVNANKIKEYKKNYYENNKATIQAQRETTKEERNARRRDEYERNKEEINARRREKSAEKKQHAT